MYVAPLYIHAATTHYNEQLKAKYLPIYREHGKCHLCGSVVTQTSLVSHFGGKHRRILTFMEEDKRQMYMSMKKRSWTNFRDTGGLACKYEACGKSFRNLTMYKQHLANTHVRTELLNQTRQTIKGISTQHLNDRMYRAMVIISYHLKIRIPHALFFITSSSFIKQIFCFVKSTAQKYEM